VARSVDSETRVAPGKLQLGTDIEESDFGSVQLFSLGDDFLDETQGDEELGMGLGDVLMAVLIAIAPLLGEGLTDTFAPAIAWTVAQVLTCLVLFALAVAVFARFAGPPFTRLVGRLETAPDRLITVVSIGLIVAAAGELGSWAVSPELFSAMVVVSLLSCITAPIWIRALLRRGPVGQSVTWRS
jgi:hypothetical protein